VDLKETVYALDSTTIDLCLTLFPWAPFRSTKAAIKLHTLIDLRGNIPSFIHISDGKLHDVNVLDVLLPEPGAFYVMDRGYLDFERLHRLHLAHAFFVTRAKSNLKATRRYSHPVDRSTGLICDQTITLTVFYSKEGYPDVLRRIRFKTDAGKTLVFLDQQLCLARSHDYRTLPLPLAGGTVLQVDQATSAYQIFLWYFGECSEDAGVDRSERLRARGDREKTSALGCFPI
jgi:hypothetical protein